MAKKKNEESAEGEAPEGGKKKFKLALPSGKLPLIGGAVAAVLLFGGGGWWFLMKGKPKQEVAAVASGSDQRPAQGGAASGPRKPSAFLDLPELTVNLAAGGRTVSNSCA
jgi:flagellar basal body-associated protein FliL